MRIAIVGAGSLGMMYGARLARSGTAVMLLTRTERHAGTLRSGGIALEEAGVWTEGIPVAAESLGSDKAWPLERGDWIWLTVKQHQLTDGLLREVAGLADGGASVLCLQNGIGHMERAAAALPHAPLAAAVSTEGALRVDDCRVRHTGSGLFAFGSWPKGAETADYAQKMLLGRLLAAGIEAVLSNEMDIRVYEKLLVNAVINPLTALFGVKNGELPQHPHRIRLMAALHEESAGILKAAGLASADRSWERLLDVCGRTADNESSMLKDVRDGRETEIDWINGGIAAIARRLGMPSPLNDAAANMIKAISGN